MCNDSGRLRTLKIYKDELSGLEVAHTVVAGRRVVSLHELRTGVTITPDLNVTGGAPQHSTPLHDSRLNSSDPLIFLLQCYSYKNGSLYS